MNNAPAYSKNSQRFGFLDGVRGLAALAVVLYHLYYATELKQALVRVMPEIVHDFLSRCSLGVEAFFLLSGFVIALSVGSSRVDWKYAGNFALRRQIRLDPPYWVTIALQVVLIYAARFAGRGQLAQPPTAGGIGAHLLYIQQFLGFDHIVPIFWTLCYEVQFYAIFILAMAAAQWAGVSRPRLAQASLIAFAGSLWLFVTRPESPWCFPMWFMFQLGVLLFWTYRDASLKPTVYVAMAMVLAAAIRAVALGAERQAWQLGFVTALSVVFHVASLKDGLSTWLSWRWVQYLGRISYSLYLIHIVIGTRFITLFGKANTPPSKALLLLVIGIGASIVAADLLNRFVERPSMDFAARFKPSRQPAPVEPVSDPALAEASA